MGKKAIENEIFFTVVEVVVQWHSRVGLTITTTNYLSLTNALFYRYLEVFSFAFG